jgi:hypothetical protein
VTSAHTLIDEYVPATECTEFLTHGVLNRTIDLLRDEDSTHIVYFHDDMLHDCNDGTNCGIAANLSAVELAEIEKGVQHTLGHKIVNLSTLKTRKCLPRRAAGDDSDRGQQQAGWLRRQRDDVTWMQRRRGTRCV